MYEGELHALDEDASGSGKFRVFQQAATGFIWVETVREEVENQAYRYCNNMDKSLKLLEERTSVPPHILGNFPRAELLFVCLTKPGTAGFEDLLYTKLSNLKKLLDNGALSKEEYEQQKAKVLNNL